MPQLTLLGKFVIALAVLMVGFGAGWTSNGWRLGTQIANLKTEHEQAVNAAAEVTRLAQKAEDAKHEAEVQRLAAIDKTHTDNLKKANDETNRLQRCLDNGTCGLRVNVVGSCSADRLPGSASSGRMDLGSGAQLTADARRSYFDLRAGIATVTEQLGACQESLSRSDARAIQAPIVYSLPAGGKLPSP